MVKLYPYVAPAGTHPEDGGGSGGARDRIHRQIEGIAPRAMREQLTPPQILRMNMQPRIAAEASVIAPPDMTVPRTQQMEILSPRLPRPPMAPAWAAGSAAIPATAWGPDLILAEDRDQVGGAVEAQIPSPGNGVSMPRAIYQPEPEFSEEARRVRHQGEVTLQAIIGTDGVPRNLMIVRSLGMGLDEKALEAVRTWRFEPGKMNGRPVAVKMNVIVNFRLY